MVIFRTFSRIIRGILGVYALAGLIVLGFFESSPTGIDRYKALEDAAVYHPQLR